MSSFTVIFDPGLSKPNRHHCPCTRYCSSHLSSDCSPSSSLPLPGFTKPAGVGAGFKTEVRLSEADRDLDHLLAVCTEVLRHDPAAAEQVGQGVGQDGVSKGGRGLTASSIQGGVAEAGKDLTGSFRGCLHCGAAARHSSGRAGDAGRVARRGGLGREGSGCSIVMGELIP